MEQETILDRRAGYDRRVFGAFVYTGPERRKFRDRRRWNTTVRVGGQVYGYRSGNELISVQGNWSGRMTGTDTANVSVQLKQDKAAIHGLARIDAPTYEPVVYNLTGLVEGDSVSMNLILDKDFENQTHPQSRSVKIRSAPFSEDMAIHGDITVHAKVLNGRAIKGKWFSTIGTGGDLFLTNRAHETSENQVDNKEAIKEVILALTK